MARAAQRPQASPWVVNQATTRSPSCSTHPATARFVPLFGPASANAARGPPVAEVTIDFSGTDSIGTGDVPLGRSRCSRHGARCKHARAKPLDCSIRDADSRVDTRPIRSPDRAGPYGSRELDAPHRRYPKAPRARRNQQHRRATARRALQRQRAARRAPAAAARAPRRARVPSRPTAPSPAPTPTAQAPEPRGTQSPSAPPSACDEFPPC